MGRIGSKRFGRGMLLICLAVSVLVSGIVYYALHQMSIDNIERIRTIYADRTENYVNSVFHNTDVLAAVVKIKNGDITEDTFKEVAKIVYTKSSGIRGVQYMPGAVVTYSYPIEGNEAVMGKNFLEIPERRNDCLLAINTKNIALSGPYNLIQGGLGLVARNPIFLTDESGKEYFWGFSAIVLDLPDALESVGLGDLNESGYDFQLFCVNENNERIVIEGNEKLDVDQAVCGSINVPNHTWTLAIKELYPWKNWLIAGGVFCICILLSLMLRRLYNTMAGEKEAIKAKSEFFSSVSHDTRTPLNAILGFSSLAMLPDTTLSQKDEYLSKINSAGKLMLDLVNDTLTISKSENGKLQNIPVPTELMSLLDSITAPINELAKQNGVSFKTDFSGLAVKIVLVDKLNFEKIFLNLLNNAVKFTPKGGHVWFSVRSEQTEKSGVDIIAVIRDDGIGMSHDFMQRMYDPFAQEQRKGYEGIGTGLGLPIVRKIVDLMKGNIQVESVEGRGTTFTVRLTLSESNEEAEPVNRTEEIKDFSKLSGKKALLCEDNEVNMEIAVALLKSKEVETVCAVNGNVGIEKFSVSKPNEYDFILMDLRMPVMDGITASKAIRALDREDAKTIPIIAMTADVFDDDVQKCIEAGMNGHISKPIDPQKMYETILSIISKNN
jgi:signal transduction histidine kinase/CheY-like chemotaxis protein/sensor domain CHASE-containing protein